MRSGERAVVPSGVSETVANVSAAGSSPSSPSAVPQYSEIVVDTSSEFPRQKFHKQPLTLSSLPSEFPREEFLCEPSREGLFW